MRITKRRGDETPQDLLAQIPRVLELIDAFGVPAISHPGLEADDIIATITQRVLDDPDLKDVRIRIVSRDKDLEQLLCDRVTMYDIHKDEEIDVAKLKELKGITPEQVVDVLALMGDAVDNVPGVPGIGPKTAASLVQEFGSIEGILANLDKIKGKRRENLEAAKDQFLYRVQLVTLKRDGDFPFNLDDAQVKGIDLSKIIPLFQQLGFRRYQHEVRKLALGAGPCPGRQRSGAAGGGGHRRGRRRLPGAGRCRAGANAVAARGPCGRRAQARSLRTHPRPGPARRARRDAEKAGTHRRRHRDDGPRHQCRPVRPQFRLGARPRCVCAHALAGKGAPPRHRDGLERAQEVLEDPAIKKCGHNIKFDARILANAGVKLRGVVFDSMLASILLDPAKPGHKLEQLALDLLGYAMIPISDLIGSGDGSISMAEVPLEKVGPYAAEDADISLRLYHQLLPQIRAAGMEELLTRVEAPLAVVLAEMERNGITCDPEELMRQGEELSRRVEKLRARIYEYAGCEFNLDSPKQLGEVLFEKLGLPAGKRTKTGYSTDIEVLTNLAAEEDPSDPRTLVPGLLIEYRQLAKLINTYLGNLRDAIDPKTGRIHSTFHQLVTATGRLASQNPNLQNIPVRTDVGRQIRKAFVAPPGHVLICADYSQIELRILAHFSEDPGLIEAFEKGLDIHAAVASQVFGVAIDEVTREQRAHAKTINFGIIYGITPYGLARRIEGLDVARAAELIADYKRALSRNRPVLAGAAARAGTRLRDDHLGPAPGDSRDPLKQPGAAGSGRAPRDQLGGARERRRPHQGSDGQPAGADRSGANPSQAPPPDPRRARL